MFGARGELFNVAYSTNFHFLGTFNVFQVVLGMCSIFCSLPGETFVYMHFKHVLTVHKSHENHIVQIHKLILYMYMYGICIHKWC